MASRPCSAIRVPICWCLSSSFGVSISIFRLEKTFELELGHTSDNLHQFVGTVTIGAPVLSPVSVSENSNITLKQVIRIRNCFISLLLATPLTPVQLNGILNSWIHMSQTAATILKQLIPVRFDSSLDIDS